MQVAALMDLARADERLGQIEAARGAWQRALAVAGRIGASVLVREITDRLAELESGPPNRQPS
ncbi:hypothetical protein ABZ754_23520 [Micromonospora purpureochromogenes]|uniref:hypothetical protein n=1 Tax=Micromonospora purpureochromogenes TaxID=47872 RepID=UPI0033C8AAA2